MGVGKAGMMRGELLEVGLKGLRCDFVLGFDSEVGVGEKFVLYTILTFI